MSLCGEPYVSDNTFVRSVTERDMRDPRFPKSTDPSEYEFRADGAIVRKDRWEVAVREIANMFEMSRSFEIPDLIEKIRQLQRAYDLIPE